MEENEFEECGTCKYYLPNSCRRFPPVYQGFGNGFGFARVSEFEWCGEYKKKEKQ